MRKALREAKINSSWINPNAPYENAVETFIRAVLAPSPENAFLPEFKAFAETIQAAGMWNSLSQTLLKITSPGVPDFYQGTEIWDFSLVDPDNRRPVDYARRRDLLNRLRQLKPFDTSPLIEQLMENPSEGLAKLFVTSRALCFRKSNHNLFANGSYIPLRATGDRQNHVVSFARVLGGHSVVVVAARFFMELGAAETVPIGPQVWGDSALLLRRDLSSAVYRDVFSHATVEVKRNGKQSLPLAEVFGHLPIALLEGVE
jgi:(1->4)-alpha-D-glucan 1-alpha-D-glucosylmutase